MGHRAAHKISAVLVANESGRKKLLGRKKIFEILDKLRWLPTTSTFQTFFKTIFLKLFFRNFSKSK